MCREEPGSYDVGFEPQDPGWIPDDTKDPQSALGVHVREIRGSESPVIGC